MNERDVQSFGGKEFDCTVVGAGLVGIYVSLMLSRLNIRVLNVPGGSIKESEKSQLIGMEGMSNHLEDSNFKHARPRVIGGSGEIWGGRVQEFDRWDFEQRDWLGTEAWPISWDEISKLYRDVSQQLGFDWEIEKDTETRFNSPGSRQSNSLDIRIGEYWLKEKNFFKKFKKELAASRNLFILENCNLVLIESRESWEYANNKVLKIVTSNGVFFETKTKIAVLAMGAVENSRMLLNMHLANGTIKEGEKIGIGKNFMIHLLAKFPHISEPIGVDVIKKYEHPGIYSKRIIQLSKGTQESLGITNSHGTFFPPETNLWNPKSINSAGLRFVKQYGVRFPLELYSRRGIFVEKITKSRTENIRQHLSTISQIPGKAVLSIWGEQLPAAENQIKLSSERDPYGVFKSEVKIGFSELDLHSLALSATTIENIFLRNQNIGNIETYKRNRLVVEEGALNGPLWGHQMGGTKMAKSQFGGVVRKTGETYTFPGIYVCGTSAFPSGSHAAPTFTALAISLLACRDIESKLISRE